ncbi:MAG: diaminopimelate decarboxylase [Christensenellales bacterium]|jgi:diaminopimelate decarboxylase
MEWADRKINEAGRLVLGGCDTAELVKEFGTPLYVMEEDKIRSVCRAFKQAIDANLVGRAYFASKAFLNTAMCKIIQQEGLGMDVVSGAELYTALKAGFPPVHIHLHGNVKTDDELRMAIRNGVGSIVIDNGDEVDRIGAIARSLGRKAYVMLRMRPNVDAHTHKYIMTGNMDSKFGVGKDEVTPIIRNILAHDCLVFEGLHCHIGSQIFELEPFEKAVDTMVGQVAQVMAETGCDVNELNFGGGYGIHYTNEDKPLSPGAYVAAMAKQLKASCEKAKIPVPRFGIEPGRSIVGEAGTTLYTVGSVKDIPGVRKYVAIDGGMPDNPRPALYQAKYFAMVANRALEPADDLVSIAGRCCESGDMIAWDIMLAKAEYGDIIAVFSTGAYNFSMASNYNKLPIPAIVLVKDGKAELMKTRQSFEDLLRNDCIPSWLED